MKKVVVLAGDYGYIRQLEATIKSILYHNKNIKIYLFNQDIPREWFNQYKWWLSNLDSELIDIKLLNMSFATNWTLNENIGHINHMTFARYYIPQFVTEDIVLYLDSDLIVTGNLDVFFDIPLNDYYLAASRAAFGYGTGFNAGVMLINNKKWKEENIAQQLIELTNKEFANVLEGDQSILNMLLGHHYLLLEDRFNFQIGYDHGAEYYNHIHIFDISLDPLPLILHYVSADKPWNTYSQGRLREVWWQYSLMEWSDILKHHGGHEWSPQIKATGEVLVLTNSYLIEHIDFLVRQLPDVTFHIAAFTLMAENLLALGQYGNVILMQGALRHIVSEKIKNCDIYLDINYQRKFDNFLELVIESGKPSLSFDNVTSAVLSTSDYHQVISSQEPEKMVEAIREILSKK